LEPRLIGSPFIFCLLLSMSLILEEKDVEAGESRYGKEPPKLCSRRPDEILLCEMNMYNEIGGSAAMEEDGAEGRHMKTLTSNYHDVSRVTDTYENGDREMQEGNESRWKQVVLAYQTLGVVFGGLATSPLYVYPSMNLKSPDEEDYLGILSLMLWTLSMIGVVKYVFLALRADDRGEGVIKKNKARGQFKNDLDIDQVLLV